MQGPVDKAFVRDGNKISFTNILAEHFKDKYSCLKNENTKKSNNIK